jgi:hypothetical protein
LIVGLVLLFLGTPVAALWKGVLPGDNSSPERSSELPVDIHTSPLSEAEDADRDSILDSGDACPSEREVLNGILDEDGCADERKQGPHLYVSSVRMAVGEQGVIAIVGSGFAEPGLGAWSMNLKYVSGRAKAVSCANLNESAACNPAFAQNMVRISGAAATGLVGDIVLASVAFECRTRGPGILKLEVDTLADGAAGAPKDIAVGTSVGLLTCVD